MSKQNEYFQGRFDGLRLALKAVESGGIEALKEEIEQRKTYGNCTNILKNELLNYKQTIEREAIITLTKLYQTLILSTLHDECGFGAKRLERFKKRLDNIAECLAEGRVTFEDYEKMLKDEVGIKITQICVGDKELNKAESEKNVKENE